MDIKKSFKSNGHLEAISSFIIWGLVPIYWHYLHAIPAALNTSLRIMVTAITINILFWNRKLFKDLPKIFKEKKLFFTLMLTSLLITSNWYVFLVSFQKGMVWQASLGYFLSPLCNVLLAIIFLKEKLSTPLKLATLFILIAISNMVWHLGSLPWISLYLCLSFSFYALIKKGVKLSAQSGLNLEVLLILPFAIWGIFVDGGLNSYQLSTFEWEIMALSGLVTLVPLILYNSGAQKIPFGHLAIYQYIAPSLQFFVAVIIFKEHLDPFHYQSFFLIWCGLMVFTWERIMTIKRKKGIIT